MLFAILFLAYEFTFQYLKEAIADIFYLYKKGIQANPPKTKPILLKRGVMQGSSLLPALYNLATDHILNELSEQTIAIKYGFLLTVDLKPLSHSIR